MWNRFRKQCVVLLGVCPTRAGVPSHSSGPEFIGKHEFSNPRDARNGFWRLLDAAGWRCCSLFLLLAAACWVQARPPHSDMTLMYEDDYGGGLDQWVVEQQPGGRVWTEEGKLIIEDEKGCTVWFAQKLKAPVVITYKIKASSQARVSDINCFWMASEPGFPEQHFREDHQRDGSFASYDLLQTYYVGMGGNSNTTTRFRRYEGGGQRPLLPEHDLSDAVHMLTPDQEYEITLVAANGVASYYRDGELLFQWHDPDPLEEGWFGFRTVWSRLEIRSFRVWAPEAPRK
jgi:hypothetical protein